MLVAYALWLLLKWREIKKNRDVQLLTNVRQEQNRGLEVREQKARAEAAFREFCKQQRLSENTLVAQHLNAIFLAGWEESRLEVADLINHTTSNLFKWNGLLRSVLAVFIVIGLLGTLFGLTDSLAQLSPTLETSGTNETSAANGEKMTQALSLLLGEIKSAFAPSILGIIFTVFGVIIYNIHLQLVCHPVRSIIERLTLTVWVPQLYPTTSQKLIQTLQHSETQMRRGYETATQVGELVGSVQSNISDFNKNLSQANTITQPLSESVSKINSAADVFNEIFTEKLKAFSQQFSENVARLTSFQNEIRKLYQQLKDESEVFQQGANEKLDEQNQNLVKTLNALENYESTYIASCQRIDKTLQEFLNKATEANANIETTNRDFLKEINASNHKWIEEIQNQLRKDLTILKPTLEKELATLTNELTTNLKDVQGTLDEWRETFNNQLNKFNAPIKEVADQIRGTFQNLVRYTDRVVGDLQVEIKQQNENYEDQLKAVTDLNHSILELLNKLDKNSENQSDAVRTLNSTVNSLSEDMNSLTNTIKTFTSDSGDLSQSIGSIEGHAKTLGNAADELVKKADVTGLNANIGKLTESIGEMVQHSRTLATSAERLAQQTSSSNRSFSEETGKSSLLERIWNSVLRKKGR